MALAAATDGRPSVRPRVSDPQRTVQVRLGSNPAVPRDGCTVAHFAVSRHQFMKYAYVKNTCAQSIASIMLKIGHFVLPRTA